MTVRSFPYVSVLCGVVLACGDEAAVDRPRLRALTDYYRGVHTSITFELPDSGGYLANGAAIERARIPAVLREVFAGRTAELRAVFVVDNPVRPWRDVAWIEESAKAAGGEAFDAALSNRLPLTGWRTLDRQ